MKATTKIILKLNVICFSYRYRKCIVCQFLYIENIGSDTTLNYRVVVERYPFPNGVVGGSIPVERSSLYLTGKTS